MYLLYLDESGVPELSRERYFVLGGLAVFERQTYFLSQRLDEVQRNYSGDLGDSPRDFHAGQIRAGRGRWRRVKREIRERILADVATVLGQSNPLGVVLFAVAAEKSRGREGESLVRKMMEQMCLRFDEFLARRYREEGDPQRGLVIVSEGRFHLRARAWIEEFRAFGTRWGDLRNFSDIPYFAAARETRLLQAADFVSYAVWRFYEHGDQSYVAPLLDRFDRSGGVVHGLFHFTAGWRSCGCLACTSRRSVNRREHGGV